jgi:flagellar hook-basal body complex protein FliE
MEGLTVKGAGQFLQTGSLDFKTLRPDSGASSASNFSGIQRSEGSSFAETLKKSLKEVNQIQKVADQKIEELITGKTDNIAEVMIAKEQADVALRLMMQVRNKVLEAYQEIMKMQV